MKDIQAQHKQWVDANFPQQPKELPAAGMVEEAGELLHALIAMYRIARWGSDKRYSLEKLDADLIDAIGDCCIYMVSYCNAADWDFYKLYVKSPPELGIAPSHVASGVQLVNLAVRFFEAQTKDVAKAYITQLRKLAIDCGYSFEQCVRDTWHKVQERKR